MTTSTSASHESLRLLLCDGDTNFGMLLSEYLSEWDYTVDYCTTGEQALRHFSRQHADICLLDITLSGMDGFELAGQIRGIDAAVPLLFLTERRSEEDILRGYAVGCDEYIIKPCPMRVLLQKIAAVLRRTRMALQKQETVFDLGNSCIFDSLHRTLAGQLLTSHESELLLQLCRSKDSTVERSFLLRQVWNGDNHFADRSLNVYINRLRKVLTPTSVQIDSVRGKGYRLVDK